MTFSILSRSVAQLTLLVYFAGMTDDSNPKVRESRLRRVAYRLGYRLEKSRERNPMLPSYGRFLIWRLDGSLAVGVSPGQDWLTLDEIEEFLTQGNVHDNGW
jgi:hypothetical protein